MLNTKEYFKQLEAIPAVKELDDEVAATIQGGWDLEAFKDINYRGGRLAAANVGFPRLNSADNHISSLKIHAGKWRFYNFPDYSERGGYKDLGPGQYPWVVNAGIPNDWISSFKRIG